MNTLSSEFICDAYYGNYSGSTEIRHNEGKTKFTFSQGTECGIVRSNFSQFNLNILLVSVPKRKRVTGEWRKLLHNLFSSPGHVTRMGQGRKVYKVLVGKLEGKRPLGRPRRRRRMGSEWILGRLARGVNCIRLAQDRDRRRAIVISPWIYNDTSLWINIDMFRWIHSDVSMDTYRYILID
jgi:hypothetical protein